MSRVNDAPSSFATALVIFDGDCSFCRRWANRWREIAGDALAFEPYQQAAARFPKIPVGQFGQAVHLVEAGGKIRRGADAVYAAMSIAGQRQWPAWMYERVPGFAKLSEFAYDVVSRHRGTFDSLDRFFLGKSVAPTTYFLTRRIFFAVLGVVHLIAIVSLWIQIDGLVGSRGIWPIAEHLPPASVLVDRHTAPPTLLLLGTSDAWLHATCAIGSALAVLLILNIAPAVVLAGLFAIYLSLTVAGGVFLHFQWDALLIETTFLALFFAPLQLRPRLGDVPAPSKLALVMLFLLVFRLNFMSGLVKLTAGDPNWHNGLALKFHYETQPLPIWTSWYMHHLPQRFGEMSVKLMFFVELFLPVLIFLPRRMRRMAAFGLILFQLLLVVTGNYGYFNLLAIAICIPLLDDACWPARWRAKIGPLRLIERRSRAKWTPWVLVPVFVFMLFTGVMQILLPLGPRMPEALLRDGYNATALAGHYRVCNSYGLFRVMTTERPELILQGSDDGVAWKDYEFRYKPGDPMRRPAFTWFHMPRLDWLMWFQALDDVPRPWFENFVTRIAHGEPSVRRLLAVDPFEKSPPKFLRVIRYAYRFTSADERFASGAWWSRKDVGEFFPRRTFRPYRENPSPQN